ncbi:MAG: leucine-rich repeat protein [Ruminococcus sp.]|nr:leucine-rich repeat protein [Ruminococcus sp.]
MKFLKKNLSLLLVLLLLFSIAYLNVSAKTTYNDFVIDFDTSSKYLRICEYNGSEENVVIPDSISGYNVHYIDDDAFIDNSTLVNIKLPYYLTSIGAYAFYNCNALSAVEIPSFVTYIGEKAFANCSSLSKVVINSKITYLNSSVFENCTSLTNVTLPNTLTNISSNAFKNCSSLRLISIPDSVTSIDSNAFSGCNENLCVIASEDSYAAGFCAENNINCVSSIKYGDINDDGKINVKDVTYLQKHLAGFEDYKIVDGSRAFYAADVNGNGDLEITDCTTIMKYAVRAIDKFPVEQ